MVKASPGPGAVAAQQAPPSILSLLDPGSRALQSGTPATGLLTEQDYFLPEGSPVQAWGYQGRAGESVTFDLVSTDFDALLYLTGPGLDGLLGDDDGGGGCNSRLTVTLPADGRFLVVASSVGFTGAGSFTLAASVEPGPPTGTGGYGAGSAWDPAVLESMDAMGRVLGPRDERQGMIGDEDRGEDGSYLQAWNLEGSAGLPVTVDLVSEDFDAFLLVSGPGLPEVATDDDGGGACHARLSLTFPVDGPYRLVVSVVGDPGEGNFTLRTSEQPGPLAEGPCGTFGDILGALGGDLSVLARAETYGRVHPGTGVVAGTLSEDDDRYPGGGGPMQVWALQGTAGSTVVIDVRSDDFDALMAVAGPGIPVPWTDDDGGEGFNSRLTVTFPGTGEYRIAVTSVGHRTGGYTVEVTPATP